MRLIPLCMSLLLGALMAGSQQPQAATGQKPAQASATKQTTSSIAHKTASKHRGRHHRRNAAAGKHAKKAESTQIPVDVITGGETRHVVLDKAPAAAKHAKGAPQSMRVEVINGSAQDTQYFSDGNQEAAHNQRVVVGVQSSDTRFAGGNKNPVVTAVASSSSVDAKSASTGGQPVAKQISPRPKRPAYAPDQH